MLPWQLANQLVLPLFAMPQSCLPYALVFRISRARPNINSMELTRFLDETDSQRVSATEQARKSYKESCGLKRVLQESQLNHTLLSYATLQPSLHIPKISCDEYDIILDSFSNRASSRIWGGETQGGLQKWGIVKRSCVIILITYDTAGKPYKYLLNISMGCASSAFSVSVKVSS